MANTYEYGPFGQVVAKTEAVEMPYQFNTKYTDKETGLVYYGYRFLDTVDGRWLNRDPIGVNGGINIYNSVSNNMVNGFSGGVNFRSGMELRLTHLLPENYNYVDSFGLQNIDISIDEDSIVNANANFKLVEVTWCEKVNGKKKISRKIIKTFNGLDKFLNSESKTLKNKVIEKIIFFGHNYFIGQQRARTFTNKDGKVVFNQPRDHTPEEHADLLIKSLKKYVNKKATKEIYIKGCFSCGPIGPHPIGLVGFSGDPKGDKGNVAKVISQKLRDIPIKGVYGPGTYLKGKVINEDVVTYKNGIKIAD